MLRAELSEIVGKILSKVAVIEDRIDFSFDDGSQYTMYHYQECCENVIIESIDGDINRLVGQKIIEAREEGNNEQEDKGIDFESRTWTFYILRTNLDSVTIRWFGVSNGYYSERADLYRTWPAAHDHIGGKRVR